MSSSGAPSASSYRTSAHAPTRPRDDVTIEMNATKGRAAEPAQEEEAAAVDDDGKAEAAALLSGQQRSSSSGTTIRRTSPSGITSGRSAGQRPRDPPVHWPAARVASPINYQAALYVVFIFLLVGACYVVYDLYGPSLHPKVDPTLPTARRELPLWNQRVRAIDADLAVRGPSARTLFIGDSITEGWNTSGRATWVDRIEQPYGAVNLGVGGDQTQHVLWRLLSAFGGQLAKVGNAAEIVVLMLGTNNSGYRLEPSDTLLGLAAVVRAIRLELGPTVHILVLSIIPRADRAYAWQSNARVNEHLRAAVNRTGEKVFVYDVNQVFLQSDSPSSSATTSPPIDPALYLADRLHLSSAGYSAWWSAGLEPLVSKHRAMVQAERKAAAAAAASPSLPPTTAAPIHGPATTIPTARASRFWHQANQRITAMLRGDGRQKGGIGGAGRPSESARVAFIGDSITERFELELGAPVWREDRMRARSIVQLGVTGDQTQHVLWRLSDAHGKQLALLLAQARGHLDVVVLLIGTNHVGQNPPAETVAGIQAIVRLLRGALAPHVQILVLAIFPRADSPKAARENQLVNGQLKQAMESLMAEGTPPTTTTTTREAATTAPTVGMLSPEVWVYDLNSAFTLGHEALLSTDSTPSALQVDLANFTPDGLHLSEAGYRAWADAVLPIVDTHLERARKIKEKAQP